jgi:hypothetical protein
MPLIRLYVRNRHPDPENPESDAMGCGSVKLSNPLLAGCGGRANGGSCCGHRSDGQSAAIALVPGACRMRIESSGQSQGNPRLYELIEHAPKTGKSPTVWAWPELIDYLKIAGQPVAGPWPPHQEPRPDPDYESGPVAIPDPHAEPAAEGE